MLRLFKKTIAVCLIGFGLGTIMVLLLPVTWWLFITGVVIIAVGLIWLSC
ncbi:MAG: hypothetical protein IKG42_05050 [Clostridia bacterium]|nr:hypothetical protein [Clostridia bacterium]